MEETWKSVKGYENYRVSDLGRVKSLNFNRTGEERIMETKPNSNGYLNVGLWAKGAKKVKMFRVNRLVALMFIPTEDTELFVNHKDGDRTNNHLKNLEWSTHRENVTHSYRNQLAKDKLTGAFQKKRKGKWNGRWASAIRLNNRLTHLGYFDTELEAHQRYLQELQNLNLTNSYA